jgi:DNA repair ATPase RecN
MKIYFYTWDTYYREEDWDDYVIQEGQRIETFTTPEASLNAYKKHKRKIDKLNSLQDEKHERHDFATFQRWSITEPVGLEVKGYQDLKRLCKYLVNSGEMEYDQSN